MKTRMSFSIFAFFSLLTYHHLAVAKPDHQIKEHKDGRIEVNFDNSDQRIEVLTKANYGIPTETPEDILRLEGPKNEVFGIVQSGNRLSFMGINQIVEFPSRLSAIIFLKTILRLRKNNQHIRIVLPEGEGPAIGSRETWAPVVKAIGYQPELERTGPNDKLSLVPFDRVFIVVNKKIIVSPLELFNKFVPRFKKQLASLSKLIIDLRLSSDVSTFFRQYFPPVPSNDLMPFSEVGLELKEVESLLPLFRRSLACRFAI